jgi:glucose-6-phosphate isomerase
VTDETLRLLGALADEAGLAARIESMFLGEKINPTEGRAVLHTALRAPRASSIMVDGQDVVPEVHAVLDRMADLGNRVRQGTWTGHTSVRGRMTSFPSDSPPCDFARLAISIDRSGAVLLRLLRSGRQHNGPHTG